MPMCSVIGCGIRKTPNQPSLTIHRIPRNERKKKEWLEAIRMENIKPNVKDVYICSLHFDDKCFNKTLDVTRLRDDAVPFKFVRQHASQHKSGILKGNQLEISPVLPATTVTTPAHGTLDVRIPILPLKTGLALNPAPAPISGTSGAATSALPTTMTTACTVSFASVPGTSGVDDLPNQAQKIKKLEDKCDFLRKKVKTLNEKARRQSKKIAEFHNIIKHLKERNLVNNENSKVLEACAGPKDFLKRQVLQKVTKISLRNLKKIVIFHNQ